MQINFSQNIKTVNNYPKIGEKRSYSTPVDFCGADVFVKPAVKFSKELCIDTVNKLLKGENISEIKKTMSIIKMSDPELIELDRLATVYKNSSTLENKKILLKHEENMHWQELETPKIGLVRCFHDMTMAGIGKDFIPAMNISTINGIGRTQQAYDALGLKFEPDEKHFNLLKNLIEKTPDDSPFAIIIKRSALTLAFYVKKDFADFAKLAKYIKENTNNEGLKILANRAINGSSKYNELEFLNKLSGGELKDFEKTDVIKTLAKNKSKKLAELLPAMIKDKKASHEAKLTAVWAAGRCQSKENFDLLYKIVNNKASKNLETREMAVNSLALYLRSNENKVKQTLNNVIKEKSDLSELATILLEKTEGIYYTKDKELANLSEAEKALYKNIRNKYVETDFKVNVQKTNMLDRAFAPFKKVLANLADNDSKMHIMDDTYTKVSRDDIGIREFTDDPAYGGDFNDSTTMVSDFRDIFINKKMLNLESKHSFPAHEFNHAFVKKCISYEDKNKLKLLYQNAVNKDKCLDNYAKLTPLEYFAQGYEAYVSVYKPHSIIIENNNFYSGLANLRSTLKRKDPDLYNFIEECIKNYNS